MTEEKRLCPRAVVRLPAEIRLKGAAEWREALLYDLSEAGAAILLPFSLPLSTEMSLRFRLPPSTGGGAHEVETSCLVVRMAAVPGRARQ